MKHYRWGLILLSLLISLSFGCSSDRSSTPLTPSNDANLPTDLSDDSHGIMASGTFEINPEDMTIQDVSDRISSFHYNITTFIGGYFRFYIENVSGPLWTIRLEIENPTALQVHDVRIIYTNLYGKKVANPDGFTNFLDPPGGQPYNPFHYFAKEYDNHAFPIGPGAIENQELILYWPAGAQWYVTYAIECSLGGNAAEPIKISEIEQVGDITPAGGGKIITCDVDDWQDDISSVWICASDFNSEDVEMYQYGDSNTYIGSLVNLNGVVPGKHIVWIRAESDNPNNIKLWMPIILTVLETTDDAPQFGYVPYCDPENVSVGVSSNLNGGAEDPQGDGVTFYWEQISPSSPTGAFTGSGGANASSAVWSPPQVDEDTQYLMTIRVGEQSGSQISRAVVEIINHVPLPPEIINGPRIVPSPLNENTNGQFSVIAEDPNQPGIPVVFDYYWEQMSPTAPTGVWYGTSYGHGRYPVWIAPEVGSDTSFTFRVTITKDWTSPPMTTEGFVEFDVTDVD